MRTIKIEEAANQDNSFNELPKGGFGIVTQHTVTKYVGHLVHKNYNGDIVILNSELGDFWINGQHSDTSRLRILPKGSKITITI